MRQVSIATTLILLAVVHAFGADTPVEAKGAAPLEYRWLRNGFYLTDGILTVGFKDDDAAHPPCERLRRGELHGGGADCEGGEGE